jgi:hypothetical protein
MGVVEVVESEEGGRWDTLSLSLYLGAAHEALGDVVSHGIHRCLEREGGREKGKGEDEEQRSVRAECREGAREEGRATFRHTPSGLPSSPSKI